MAYLALNELQREQNRLQLHLIKYSLNEQWRSSQLIADLRARLYPRMPRGLFDPQDLEHQVLFRLTTFAPDDITDEVIDETIREQLSIIEHRLSDVPDREYLYRGFNPRSKDLNIDERLELKNDGGKLYATGYGRTIDVEFKKITDDSIIKLFTEKLHYIHSGRHKGEAFGFYFAGDDIPWGVETVEPSLGVKKYKRDALLAHGIDPNKAVEITRLYLLPGSPKNAISILDGLVSRYYKDKGMEAMYTTTMPMYAKTRGATTAGGMKDVLLVKEQSHKFHKATIDGRNVYVHNVSSPQKSNQTLYTHSKFPTLLTVETFMRLNKNHALKPLDILKKKVIYINPSHRRSEKHSEMRFTIKNLSRLFEQLQELGGNYIDTAYIADTFWGYKSLNKLRLRQIVQGGEIVYESSCKYRVSKESHIRTLVNDLMYIGDDYGNAVSAIKVADNRYEPENSLEKTRTAYRLNDTLLFIDIYPFGAFIKITGENDSVCAVARLLHFDQSEDIDIHADGLYLKWAKAHKLEELWHIKFGLHKENEAKT